MGCVSSKIITRSRSFQEDLGLSLKRRTIGFPLLEGLIKSKDDDDDDDEYQNLQNFSIMSQGSSSHLDTIINLSEVMNGLEEEEEEEEEEDKKKRFSISSWKFHTVEEYDALLALNQNKQISDDEEPDQDIKTIDCVDEKRFREKGKRKKSFGRELKPLELQSFEFSNTGSLREWIEAGGQVLSPGSYHTPKFGKDSVSRRIGRSKDGKTGEEDDDDEDDILFDPELVAGIEIAMKQLTEEEEHILELMLEKISRN